MRGFVFIAVLFFSLFTHAVPIELDDFRPTELGSGTDGETWTAFSCLEGSVTETYVSDPTRGRDFDAVEIQTSADNPHLTENEVTISFRSFSLHRLKRHFLSWKKEATVANHPLCQKKFLIGYEIAGALAVRFSYNTDTVENRKKLAQYLAQFKTLADFKHVDISVTLPGILTGWGYGVETTDPSIDINPILQSASFDELLANARKAVLELDQRYDWNRLRQLRLWNGNHATHLTFN